MDRSPLHYPTPRQPDYLDYDHPPASIDHLMPAVRETLMRTTGRSALGKAQAGEHVLLVVPAGQDALVLDAVLEGFREKGIEATAKYEHEVGVSQPPTELTRTSIADGWKEILWRKENAALLHPRFAAQRPGNIPNRAGLKAYLDGHPEYTAIFVGGGGQSHWFQQLEEHGNKFKENWHYVSFEDLLSRENSFPSDVWRLMEGKILDLIPDIREVRIHDPQGTNVIFSVDEEEARLWAEGADAPGILMMYPVSATRRSVQAGRVPPEKERRVYPKANGTIANTASHSGFYPHMIGHLRDGVIVRIEGGGLFGDLLREILTKTRDVTYPRHPRAGYFYLDEVSLGTNPKAFRKRVNVFNSYGHSPNGAEKDRSGAIKWGIGVHSHHPEVKAFAKEQGLPIEHGWHFHSTYFTTYEVKLRSGEWTKIVDRGHLVTLDDPEVRDLASHYGNPDELLREDWFPAIPGINYPGDYMRDYGQDPVEWVRKENEGRLPDAIGVPQPS